MTAEIAVSRFPSETFRGEVTRISPTIDLMTRTARVEVRLENPGHRLMPGMLARVQLQVERREQVVVLPFTSLIVEMGADGEAVHRVYVLKGDRVEGRQVTLGIVDADRVQVASGLSFGDTVVTRGQHALRDGRQVQVQEPRWFKPAFC